ncbi:phosphosulfolactate synthase [Paenibacillus koleovorans]|uniref:phosphosulfolactate synthase n=1 Tax=Paenibacillus koleovorans TaxID=121608 RepID=UPI000FD7AC50|nr:phosphosulfolactate synthase [Paenibacillus koleovorans]
MDVTSRLEWPAILQDPTGQRQRKPRTSGKTMVIDKGLGLNAFEDLLLTAAPYIDMLKLGFGTSPLYPMPLLQQKLRMAAIAGVEMMPGGTFLEVAVVQNEVEDCLRMIRQLGFNAIEVSDGTIDMERPLRNELITRGREAGLTVYTEYGKKYWGSRIELDQLIETVIEDVERGASLVTIEARESGEGVGIFDEHGACRDDMLQSMIQLFPDPSRILWETPQKSQQVHLLKKLGPSVNLGNIAPTDVFSLESLRRGLRSDTLSWSGTPVSSQP